jgi:hypothetical protein
MKNINVIPTDKPSRFHLAYDKNYYLSVEPFIQLDAKNYKSFNIYITDDSKIQEDNYGIGFAHGIKGAGKGYFVFKQDGTNSGKLNALCEGSKKIILTTDLQLIADGVQAIDDEFLEWFVKNPSCESVRVNNLCYGALGGFADAGYKIIIPKEEPKLDLEKEMFELEQELDIPSHLRWHNSKPKQQTIEEAAAKHFNEEIFVEGVTIQYALQEAFIIGAEWQAKRMYSEEEVIEVLTQRCKEFGTKNEKFQKLLLKQDLEWFEQFKKK